MSIYNYRPHTDSKERFLETEWTSRSPQTNPFAHYVDKFVKHNFLIESVSGKPEIVEGYAIQRADGTVDDSHIYAYDVSKRRRQNRQKAGEYKETFHTCDTPKRGYSSVWTYRIYRMKTENVSSFSQGSRSFYVDTVSDEQRAYLLRRRRGYPETQSNGWFPGSHLQNGLQQISQVIRGMDQKWLDFSSTKYIEIRIDRRDGAFIVKDQNGEIITDPDKLRNIFSGISKPRN